MAKSRDITALAPWFGSARTIADKVGEALAGRSWVGIPFAGGMCELRHIKASSIVVNDLHKHIINLARVVADPYSLQILRKRLQRLPFHPDTLRQAQEAASMEQWEGYEWTEWTGDIKAATAYFVSQWMGRSGKAGTDDEFSGNLSVRWNSNGGDSNTRYRSAVKSLAAWNHVMQRCNFVCMDAIDFVKKVPDDNSAAIYCDPPFPDAGDDYAVKFGEKDQVRLAAYLVQYSLTRVVCRFYDHPLIREIYPESLWNWRPVEGRKQSNANVTEYLISRN